MSGNGGSEKTMGDDGVGDTYSGEDTRNELPADQRAVLDELGRLGSWASELRWDDVPEAIRARFRLILLDSLGVTLLGSRLPERGPLVAAWAPAPGPSPVFGAGVLTSPEAAAWLNATALVGLEMDEGNKFAAGHPAAHGFPAVIASAAALDADGPTTAAALLVAYEVAARFGRASKGIPGLHPHGNWGVAGAAAGCARLLGLSPERTTAAIDTASGMPIAGHFAAALDGNPVRNEWMGASNMAGLAAARLAQGGLAHATGIAARSLGTLLGSFDPSELTAGLGERWDVELGYFKRHSSCAFTHPSADATLALRERLLAEGRSTSDIARVEVRTYSIAATLSRTRWANRLAAMFSIPYVVSTALIRGTVDPDGFAALGDPELLALAARVGVSADEDFDSHLPDARGAAVRLILADGSELEERVANPVGDAAHEPYDLEGTLALLSGLLGGPAAVERITAVVDALEGAAGVRALLHTLSDP